MQAINESLLLKVETALSIKLTDGQRNYLLHNGPYDFGDRQTGKTTAYCIKLALSEGPMLDLNRPDNWCDCDYGPPSNKGNYSRWFRTSFLRIWTKLAESGIMVREADGIAAIY